jgi:hypothetical protein
LEKCANSILASTSITPSWEILTGGTNGQLGWTAVMASKALHFLCRSLGFERNPPVAIDGERIRDHVWPAFRDCLPVLNRPSDWEGNTFEAYYRYMTAIRTWANHKGWSTTQVESTLFEAVNRNEQIF